MRKFLLTLLMLVTAVGWASAAETTDKLEAKNATFSGTGYKSFTLTGDDLCAEYAGNAYSSEKSFWQINAATTGIYVSKVPEGKYISKIVITVSKGSKNFYLYTSNTAYSSLPSSGSSSTLKATTTKTYSVDDDVTSFAIKGSGNAVYLASVEVTWADKTSAPVITVKDNIATITAAEDATIYYTTDGTTATTSSTVYSQPISITRDINEIHAIAVVDGKSSAETTQSVSFVSSVANPVISRDGNLISISSDVEGATVYYNVNSDSNPDESSNIYTQPFSITETSTIKAVAYTSEDYSSVVSETYDLAVVSAPVISPSSSEVAKNTKVTFACETKGAEIYYAIGDNGYMLYTSDSEIVVNETTTIHAYATKENYASSSVVDKTFYTTTKLVGYFYTASTDDMADGAVVLENKGGASTSNTSSTALCAVEGGFTSNGVNISFDSTKGSNFAYINSSNTITLYSNNQFTITAPSGLYIKSVHFTTSSSNSNFSSLKGSDTKCTTSGDWSTTEALNSVTFTYSGSSAWKNASAISAITVTCVQGELAETSLSVERKNLGDYKVALTDEEGYTEKYPAYFTEVNQLVLNYNIKSINQDADYRVVVTPKDGQEIEVLDAKAGDNTLVVPFAHEFEVALYSDADELDRQTATNNLPFFTETPSATATEAYIEQANVILNWDINGIDKDNTDANAYATYITYNLMNDSNNGMGVATEDYFGLTGYTRYDGSEFTEANNWSKIAAEVGKLPINFINAATDEYICGTISVVYPFEYNGIIDRQKSDIQVDYTVSADIIQTGVESISVDGNSKVEYFNLQGVRVMNPANGVYIRRQGNTVDKVLVK